MAIGQSLTLPQDREPIDVAAWTSRAADELAEITLDAVSSPPVRGSRNQLNIPLDDDEPSIRQLQVAGQTARSPAHTPRSKGAEQGEVNKAYGRVTPMRRDSQSRREALLRGKEGSRRRQRWENDRLLSNPYAQPPLPSDWEVRPTHPVHAVPYYLAPLWDAGIQARYAERKARTKRGHNADGTTATTTPVPRELREKLKRARGAKALLVDLEQQVRQFVEKWRQQEAEAETHNASEPDSEDEEVVFVGRNGEMKDMPSSPTLSLDSLEQREQLVFDSLEDDQGASFGYVEPRDMGSALSSADRRRRWLVHSIGKYYGLDTWSITVGDPARREAYVGIKESTLKNGRVQFPTMLPRPLYGLV